MSGLRAPLALLLLSSAALAALAAPSAAASYAGCDVTPVGTYDCIVWVDEENHYHAWMGNDLRRGTAYCLGALEPTPFEECQRIEEA